MKGTLIFDLDGTLLRSDIHICRGVNMALRALGRPPMDDAAIHRLIGKPSDEFYGSLVPDPESKDAFIGLFRKMERAVLSEAGQLYAGTADMLKALVDRGYRLAVCSNAGPSYLALALETTGIKDLFYSVVSAKGFASKAEAVQKMAESAPCLGVMLIGDTRYDAEAAMENRIPFIWADYGFGVPDKDNPLCFAAKTPADIVPLVEQIATYAAVWERIQQTPGVRCVGVNGVDTAGKTVFANRLACYLKSVGQDAVVVHLDDFHNPKALRTRGNDEIDAYYHNAFDLQTLKDTLLKPLRETGEVHKTLTLLDLGTDAYTRKRTYEIGRDTLVILEGVLLYREPIAELIDSKIYLDIGFDELLRRAEARDVPKYGGQMLTRYREKYIPVQQRYLEEWNPKETSDCVIDNSDVCRPVIVS